MRCKNVKLKVICWIRICFFSKSDNPLYMYRCMCEWYYANSSGESHSIILKFFIQIGNCTIIQGRYIKVFRKSWTLSIGYEGEGIVLEKKKKVRAKIPIWMEIGVLVLGRIIWGRAKEHCTLHWGTSLRVHGKQRHARCWNRVLCWWGSAGGEWKDRKPHGHYTRYYANGDRAEEEDKDGNLHAHRTMYSLVLLVCLPWHTTLYMQLLLLFCCMNALLGYCCFF